MKRILVLMIVGLVVFVGASPLARAQYYSREKSISDRAAGIRWEATSLQQRSQDLLRKDASVRVWKSEVDDWARGTQARAAELSQQSKQVDRGKFFAQQAAAINQANAAQIQQQGHAVYEAAQQVSLRKQQVKTFEQQLWQWKDMLDRQDKQIQGGFDRKEAAKNSAAEDNKADNVRLTAFMESNQKMRDANPAREKQIAKREAEVKAREAALEKRRAATDSLRAELDESYDRLSSIDDSLDQMSKALDDKRAAIKKYEESRADAAKDGQPTAKDAR